MKNPWKRLSKINPQPEDGTRRINYKVFDSLIKAKLPTAEMSIVLAVISKTWGYNKKSDAISISQLVDITGFTGRAIKRSNAGLKRKRIIVVGTSERVTNGTPVNEYLFNKHYDTWKIQCKKTGDRKDTGDRNGQKRVTDTPPTIDNIIYTDKLKTFVGNYIKFIKNTYPTKSPRGKDTFKNSIDVLYKLIRIDKFEENYIFNVIRWAQKDDFWKSQVYSLAGLRKKSKNGLTKFQNLSASYDKDKPEEIKPKIPVFKVEDYG